MKVRLVSIYFLLIFAVSLSTKTARADSIVRVGACATPGLCWNVIVRDSIAYIADRSATTTADVSNPSNPQVLSTLNDNSRSWALGLCLKDTVAYLNHIALSNTFSDVSVSDPESMYVLGWCYTHASGGTDPTGICTKDTIVYLAGGDDGLGIINVAIPTSPDTIKYYNTPGHTVDLTVKDTLVYIADVTDVIIINVADPLNPSYVGSVSMPSSCRSIFLVDSFAYATCISGNGLNGSLEVVKVSNPASPQIVASADNLKGDPLDVWVSGSYAYVAAGDFWETKKGKKRQTGALKPEWTFDRRADEEGGLRIVDIFNPLSPTLVASYDTPGDPRGVFAVDTLVFVADYDSLQILGHLGAGVKEENANSKDQIPFLQVFPNPFASEVSVMCSGISKGQKVSLDIYDVSGRSIKSVPLTTSHLTIGSDLSQGVYFLKLKTDENSITSKLIKVK